MKKLKNAIYPGTFDPITYGHLDVIERASKLFDTLVVGVSESTHKNPFIPLDNRISLVEQSIKPYKNVSVLNFPDLLVDFCSKQNIHVIVRGLRALSDFDYEFQMALTNRSLAHDIETIFIMASEKYSYVSSSMIREIFSLRGNIAKFVPKPVQLYLKRTP